MPDVAASTSVMIAVCTLNEADNIAPLVTQLRAAVPAAKILVVDDNSPDGTAESVSGLMHQDPLLQIVVRRNERGLGSAIRHAMQSAVEDQFTLFVNLDADFSHDPAQIPQLIERATESPEIDVVIGSRYVAGGKIVGWPLHRKFMSGMVNRFATLCLRLPVKDCSGSMRCYRVAALERIGMSNVRIDGYAVLEELLVILRRSGSKFAEVPITFTDRQVGESKLTLREAVRSMSQIIALAFKR
ncbi:MAG: polyprenol monophosphomannose synthase [Planctomycetaceae bacterium]|jgi:dolichol-phosphate mannosyltransferase|nr:polyprenol monophosphomannose synthase [Planctomycetaceae bacterium]